jgi:hypothetical protein
MLLLLIQEGRVVIVLTELERHYTKFNIADGCEQRQTYKLRAPATTSPRHENPRSHSNETGK